MKKKGTEVTQHSLISLGSQDNILQKTIRLEARFAYVHFYFQPRVGWMVCFGAMAERFSFPARQLTYSYCRIFTRMTTLTDYTLDFVSRYYK